MCGLFRGCCKRRVEQIILVLRGLFVGCFWCFMVFMVLIVVSHYLAYQGDYIQKPQSKCCRTVSSGDSFFVSVLALFC